MSGSKDAMIANTGNAFGQIHRFFLLSLTLSTLIMGATLIGPVDRSKYRDEALYELQGLDRLSVDVQRRLRSYLTVSAEPTDTAQTAIRRMLKRTRDLRIQLGILDLALTNTSQTDENRSVISDIRDAAAYHKSILNFNEVYRDLPQSPQGPKIRTSIVDHGNFIWEGGIAERGLDELARLLFWASIYPDKLELSIAEEERTSGISLVHLREIQLRLENSAQRAELEYGKQSRAASAALWVEIAEIDRDPEKFSQRLETITPRALDDALSKSDRDRRLIEDHAQGETEFSAPYVQQTLSLGHAVLLSACLVSVINLLTSISFRRLRILITPLKQGDLMTAEVRVPILAPPGDTGNIASMTLFFQSIILLLPTAFSCASLIVNVPSMWSWLTVAAVVASGLILMRASSGFGKKWSEK
ncbi:hypothetical protein [Pseudophaeobacter sp.]|uniref:hypothetical protein n=1 Tax=Pseudophaeobacter sp. TaxID=1971739 RepID=UPI003299A8E1